MSCIPCIVTQQGTVKIIESFGAFKAIARPGMTCITPCVDCVAGTISMRLQQMEVSCETKTKDNVFVTIKIAIQFQVKAADDSIQAAHYRLTNARSQVHRRSLAARSPRHAPLHPLCAALRKACGNPHWMCYLGCCARSA